VLSSGHTPNTNAGTPGQYQHPPQQQHQQLQQNVHFNDYINSVNGQGQGATASTFALLENSSPHHQHKEDWTDIPGLHDIDMNFFPQDQQMVLEHMDELEQHMDTSKQKNNTGVVPPTPRSFEIAANYHNSDFISSFDSPVIDQHSQASIRPDVVFTPLVSPAVTPLDSMMNNGKQTGFFSPLTSPALEAKSPRRLKKNSISEDPKKKYSKRKTPGSTPIVGPTIPGRIAKQSPIIKARRSTSYTAALSQHQKQQPKIDTKHEFQDVSLPDSATSVMAPPKQRTRSASKGATPATPATLMNFNKGQSPVILPSTDSRRSSTSTLKQTQRASSEDDDLDPHSKKQSHKLAEQGRRNRMNQAIVDLGALIPEELQATVTIPSKATTVELASQYIKSLANEVEMLRERLRSMGSDIMSNESISPLETTNRD
jgi:hypothetical protein